jgi:glyoxylase-like metal-dependent hydrolase (beta-lactamase superfamily II)
VTPETWGLWKREKDFSLLISHSKKEDDLIIKTLVVGPIMANCHILGCEETKEAAVVDPGDDTGKILMALAESKLNVKYILNTHGHFDHVGGNKKMKEVTKAPILIHSSDAHMLTSLSSAAAAWGMAADDSPPPDQTIEEGDTISFGKITLKVLHTPGHTPGGVSFHSDGKVFVGDTLFAGSIGRTDFPGGDFDTLISGIKKKLFPLGDDVVVYCGHGPETTIGREKRSNPFLR